MSAEGNMARLNEPATKTDGAMPGGFDQSSPQNQDSMSTVRPSQDTTRTGYLAYSPTYTGIQGSPTKPLPRPARYASAGYSTILKDGRVPSARGPSSSTFAPPGYKQTTVTRDEFDDSGDEDDDPNKARKARPRKPGKTVNFEDPKPKEHEFQEWTYGNENGRFTSTRRLSTARYSSVIQDLAITYRWEKENNKDVEYMVLYHNTNEDNSADVENIVAQVCTEHDFDKEVHKDPASWWAALHKYVELESAARDNMDAAAEYAAQAEAATDDAVQQKAETEAQIKQYNQEAQRIQEEITEQVTIVQAELDKALRQISERDARLTKASDAVARLRESRDDARQQLAKSEQTVRNLLEERQTRTRDEFDPSDDSSSSDDDGGDKEKGKKDRERERRSNGPPRDERLSSVNTNRSSRSNRTDHTDAPSDSRYPDAKEYKGTAEEDLERWISTVLTKIRRSWAMFPDEWSKIEYTRDRCAESAYEAIRHRSMVDSEEPYETLDDMLKELRANFDRPNKEVFTMNLITSGAYEQKDMPLSQWLAWFNTAAIDAKLSPVQRRFYAMRNIANKYKSAAANNGGNGEEDWNSFVKRLRQIDADQVAAWGDKPRTQNNTRTQNHSNAAGSTPAPNARPAAATNAAASSTSTSSAPKVDSYKRSAEEFKLIKAKHVCARCLKSGHMPNENPNKCPLKGKTMATFKAEDLAAMADFTGPRPAEDAENYASPA